MGLTSALYATLTGLNANQQRLDVIGNNISNVNTVGFKSSRLDFQTLMSQTLSNGSPPGNDSGGTNPLQIGMGAKQGAITRNFTDGSRQTTGVDTDLAIEGDGFFILQEGQDQVYTRDGSFKRNKDNKLVNASGYFVQGYGVDANFNIVPGTLQDLSIPIGSLTVAKATTSVTLNGIFNSSGPVASQASLLTQSQPLYLKGATATSATPPAVTDLLTNITDASNNSYFQVGDVITLTPPNTAAGVEAKSLTVTAGTTLQNYLDFITGTLGITSAAGANGAAPDGGAGIQAVVPPTSTFPANAMQLYIRGNVGTVNDINLDTGAITVQRSTSTPTPPTFAFSQVTAANGESNSQSITIYDSLGAPVTVNVTVTLTGCDSNGTTWRYYVTSPDGTTGNTTNGVGTNSFLSTGTLSFDNSGRLAGSNSPTITVDRSNTGAVPLLQFNLNLNNIQSLAGGNTTVELPDQDGFKKGTLQSFSIQADGSIDGAFDNGMHRTLGQVALATFRNNQGLVDRGDNTYVPGSNSGLPVYSAPGDGSAGNIVSQALELSNVDLSQEFVNLISASTGFSASSRIITTSNQLLQELLQSAR